MRFIFIGFVLVLASGCGCSETCDPSVTVRPRVVVHGEEERRYGGIEMVWTGSEFSVLYSSTYEGSTERYLTRLSESGLPISTHELAGYVPPYLHRSLAWSGLRYGIAYEKYLDPEGVELRFQLLDGDGNEIDDIALSNPVLIEYPDTLFPIVVSSGSEIGVFWSEPRDEYHDVYYASVGSEGLLVEPKQVASLEAHRSTWVTSEWLAVDWTGSEYGVAWCADPWDERRVHFLALDQEGNVLVEPRHVSSACSSVKNLVWNGMEFGLLWLRNVPPLDDDNEMVFSRISAEGALLGDEVILSEMYPSLGATQMSWTGSHYGLISTSYSEYVPPALWYTKLDADGTRVGSSSRVLEIPSELFTWAYVWTGSEIGFVWRGNTDDPMAKLHFLSFSICE